MLVSVSSTLSHVLLYISEGGVRRRLEASYGIRGGLACSVLLRGEVEGILDIFGVINGLELALFAHGTLGSEWTVHFVRTRGDQGKGRR